MKLLIVGYGKMGKMVDGLSAEQGIEVVGRVDDARQAFQRAFAVMQRVRERLRDERLQQAFEKNPDLATVQSLMSDV